MNAARAFQEIQAIFNAAIKRGAAMRTLVVFEPSGLAAHEIARIRRLAPIANAKGNMLELAIALPKTVRVDKYGTILIFDKVNE